MEVQSVLIPRNDFTLIEGAEWVKKNGYQVKKVDITQNYFRFRQFDPVECNKKRYRTIELKNKVLLVICK